MHIRGDLKSLNCFLFPPTVVTVFHKVLKVVFHRRLQKKHVVLIYIHTHPQKKNTVHFYQWLTGDSLLAVILMVLMALDGGLTAALSAC